MCNTTPEYLLEKTPDHDEAVNAVSEAIMNANAEAYEVLAQ